MSSDSGKGVDPKGDARAWSATSIVLHVVLAVLIVAVLWQQWVLKEELGRRLAIEVCRPDQGDFVGFVKKNCYGFKVVWFWVDSRTLNLEWVAMQKCDGAIERVSPLNYGDPPVPWMVWQGRLTEALLADGRRRRDYRPYWPF